MKTALETAKANRLLFLAHGLVIMDKEDLIKAFKEYASQFIDEAANRARIKREPMYGDKERSMIIGEDNYIDRESILSLQNELK